MKLEAVIKIGSEKILEILIMVYSDGLCFI